MRLLGSAGSGTVKSMRANRSVDSKPEVMIRKALWSNGLRGYRKNLKGLPGRPDVVFPKHRLCIFVHGCFWHGCPFCSSKRNLQPRHNADYWRAKVTRNKDRDARHCRSLARDGWRVAVYWECELKQELDEVVNDIRLLLLTSRTSDAKVHPTVEVELMSRKAAMFQVTPGMEPREPSNQ